jgi:hypothetical protein
MLQKRFKIIQNGNNRKLSKGVNGRPKATTHGFWGDDYADFVDNKGNVEEHSADGYCTNDAKRAGHFSGRKISAMFRAIYKKLCINGNKGEFLTHYSDWWGDGTGDMLFIRNDFVDAFEEWARG